MAMPEKEMISMGSPPAHQSEVVSEESSHAERAATSELRSESRERVAKLVKAVQLATIKVPMSKLKSGLFDQGSLIR